MIIVMHILVSGTRTVEEVAASRGNKNIQAVNITQIDNSTGIDVVMPMYNVIEYSDDCSKTSRSLCQYYRDKPTSIL